MYIKLQGHIEIIRKRDGRRITFGAFHSVEIDRDMTKINSSCKVRIPASSRLEDRAAGRIDSVQTAEQFSRGDFISVSLGYSGYLRQEFSGYIYRINYKSPLEIECEGHEFLLRRPCPTKTWAKTTMKDVLKYIVGGTGIKLYDKIPDIAFTKFIIGKDMTGLQALQMVKEKYGMTIFFMDDLLYAGLAYTLDLGTVKYRLGWNTIKDDDLKYRNADDVALKIKAVWIKPDNTKIEAQVGDPTGSQRTLFFYNVGSKPELEKLAAEEIKKYKYSGYEGKITTFLEPYAEPGMKGVLEDPKYTERGGTYYITRTEVKADASGGRRKVQFTIKL
jgi:hypothetical protein